jgi:hypothetical protein
MADEALIQESDQSTYGRDRYWLYLKRADVYSVASPEYTADKLGLNHRPQNNK